jgi:hypothetical protein
VSDVSPPLISARPRRAALFAVALTLLLRAAPVAAEPPGAALALSDAEVARRLAFIEVRLERGSFAANRWWNAWFYGWTALTVAQAAVAFAATDPGLRTDMAVGAVSSSLGVIPLGLFPFPPRLAAGELRALPEGTKEERRRKLSRAERLLRESAEAEAFGRSWMNHALSGVVSVGVGLLLGLGYKRPAAGVINAAGGVALCELEIFTQPTAAIDDLRAYQRWTGRGAGTEATSTAKAGWTLIPHAGGLGVAGRF